MYYINDETYFLIHCIEKNKETAQYSSPSKIFLIIFSFKEVFSLRRLYSPLVAASLF